MNPNLKDNVGLVYIFFSVTALTQFFQSASFIC